MDRFDYLHGALATVSTGQPLPCCLVQIAAQEKVRTATGKSSRGVDNNRTQGRNLNPPIIG